MIAMLWLALRSVGLVVTTGANPAGLAGALGPEFNWPAKASPRVDWSIAHKRQRLLDGEVGAAEVGIQNVIKHLLVDSAG